MSPFTQRIGQLRESGMSYEDIANELDCSVKAVKRHLEQYRSVKQAMDSPEVQAEQEVARLVYEQQIRHWRAKYNTVAKRAALEDRLLMVAKDCLGAFTPPRPSRLVLPVPTHADVEEAVAVFSDWHGGEVITPEETLGLGGFNKYIAARRVEYFTEKFCSLTQMHRNMATIKRAVVLGLGDMVSGKIHRELEKYADADIMEQVVLAASLLAQSLYDMSCYFEEVVFYGVGGNHARLEEKPEAKKAYVNWDNMAYQIAALLLRNVKNVKFSIPKSRFAIVPINGKKFLVMHGDLVRGWNSIPYYDLQRKAFLINDMLRRTETKAEAEQLEECQYSQVDGFVLGHFHRGDINEALNGPIITNGCLPGPSEYSVGRLATASRPMQFAFGVHNRQGVSWRYPLWLDDIDSPDKPLRYSIEQPEVWAAGASD